MRLVRTQNPQNSLLSLADAKAHLRVDHEDEDELISGLIEAAHQYIDGADGVLGRALHQQTWELRLDGFCSDEIRIPLPPLLSIDSITYYDTQNVLRTLSTSLYEVGGIGDSKPGFVCPVFGTVWPSTYSRTDAVVITFTAGYVLNASPTQGEVPRPIVQAVKLLIGHWYANREAVSVGVSVQEMPMASEALLAPYRVHYFA